MGFQFSALPTFEQPISLPCYRHGKVNFTFKFIPPTEIDAVIKSHKDKTSAEVLQELITDWDIKDDGGAKVPYSAEALQALLDALHCSGKIYSAWMLGLAGAAEKN